MNNMNTTFTLTKQEYIARLIVGFCISILASLIIVLPLSFLVSFGLGFLGVYNSTVSFWISFLVTLTCAYGVWIGRYALQKITTKSNALLLKSYFTSEEIAWNSVTSLQIESYEGLLRDMSVFIKIFVFVLKELRALYEKGVGGQFALIQYQKGGQDKTRVLYLSSFTRSGELIDRLKNYKTEKTSQVSEQQVVANVTEEISHIIPAH